MSPRGLLALCAALMLFATARARPLRRQPLQSAGGYVCLPNGDLQGDEISFTTADSQDSCESFCSSTDGCTFYIYLMRADSNCVLKSNLLTGQAGSNGVDPTSFVAACVRSEALSTASQSFACAEGFDFMGTELNIFGLSGSEAPQSTCQDACAANAECTFYIVTADLATCVLKKDLLAGSQGSNGPTDGVGASCLRMAEGGSASPLPVESSPTPDEGAPAGDIFEGTTPVDTSTPTTTTTTTTTTTAFGCPDLQATLDTHNAARARYGAAPLLWSETLAQYAHGVSSTCVMEHSHGPYGENLAWGTNLNTCADAVRMWMGEESLWQPGMDFTHETGHFTAVVWKGTTQVGCALVCNMVTCNYDPSGNVMGQFGDNVGWPSV